MRGFELHKVGKRMLELANPEAKQAFNLLCWGKSILGEAISITNRVGIAPIVRL